jgi:type IV secretory pathway TraG/TraD family ATPase VirD4
MATGRESCRCAVMESSWGRNESSDWPSDTPVWTISAFVIALIVLLAGAILRFEQWTPLQRYWLPQYLRANITGDARTRVRLLAFDEKGQSYLPTNADVEPGRTEMPDGQTAPVRLTDEAIREGKVLVLLPRKEVSTAWLRDSLSGSVYDQASPTDLAKDLVHYPAFAALGVLLCGIVLASPKDRERRRVVRYGRRLRGPELVSVAEFNRRHRRQGIEFLNLERSWFDRTFGKTRTLRLAEGVESRHLLAVGDTGSGKSALIRQILTQIEERDETAIVYDPALEYTPQFFDPSRGDVILNPLDERMPFWSPGDEVQHEAEALTLAASLFPDRPHDPNSFFVETPRDIFAHLLKLKPTPQELVWWMSHPEEIDRRIEGTEFAPMINRDAPAQRNGVLGTLNRVASSLKLLPSERQVSRTWNTVEWSKQRRGWIFLTSTPETRKALLPLISLWLDTLVLRLMNRGEPGAGPVWFVLDELASLQKLPQLETALTENRKSNNPVVIGLQGKAQLETIYGHMAETMLSMLTTKIFLRTSEPRAAEWISRAIGEVEIEQLRESRTRSDTPGQRESKNYQLDRRVEPLVMASELTGLPDRHAYLKSENLVVRLSFPYVELPQKEPKFIERKVRVMQKPDATTAAQRTQKPEQKISPQQEQDRNQQQQVKKHAAGIGEEFFE